jgi:cob(I)alamin adenosyltransferase
MVRIDRVVTRGGDAGETSLGDGTRVRKDSPLIAAIGAVDEANAAIGLVRTLVSPPISTLLARVQNDLFDLGADLCVPGASGARLRFSETPITRLEAEIETMNAGLPALRSFVLPGGSAAAAQAHVARTVVRRAERAVAGLDGSGGAVLRYLNRLSDHLFVLARVLNDNGAGDVLWVPGAGMSAVPGAT